MWMWRTVTKNDGDQDGDDKDDTERTTRDNDEKEGKVHGRGGRRKKGDNHSDRK